MKLSTPNLINISPPAPLKRINRKGGESYLLRNQKSAKAPDLRQSQQIHAPADKAGSQGIAHGGKFGALPVQTNGQERTVSDPRREISRTANSQRDPCNDFRTTQPARANLERSPYTDQKRPRQTEKDSLRSRLKTRKTNIQAAQGH